jgi:hypothetical protein
MRTRAITFTAYDVFGETVVEDLTMSELALTAKHWRASGLYGLQSDVEWSEDEEDHSQLVMSHDGDVIMTFTLVQTQAFLLSLIGNPDYSDEDEDEQEDEQEVTHEWHPYHEGAPELDSKLDERRR